MTVIDTMRMSTAWHAFFIDFTCNSVDTDGSFHCGLTFSRMCMRLPNVDMIWEPPQR